MGALLGIGLWSMVIGWDRKAPPPPSSRVFSDSADVSPTEIVVQLQPGTSDSSLRTLEQELGIVLRPSSPLSRELGNIMLVTVSGVAERDELIKKLRKSSQVELAEPRIHGRGMAALNDNGFPNDRRFGDQWNMRMIGLKDAWEYSTGEGVIVAVVDSGIALSYTPRATGAEDLKTVRFLPGYDFMSPGFPPSDALGHGTHVAGTIAQNTHNKIGTAGIAPNVTLLPVRVFGSEPRTSSDLIAQGIRYATKNGAHIINLSLGERKISAVVESAIKDAYEHDVLVIAAAGNDHGEVSSPACLPQVMSVSAVTSEGLIAEYSNRGRVDIAAPGGGYSEGWRGFISKTEALFGDGTFMDFIEGDVGSKKIIQNVVDSKVQPAQQTYPAWRGTSMAAPHVTGVAAMVRSMGIFKPDEIRDILRQTAQPPAKKELTTSGVTTFLSEVAESVHLLKPMEPSEKDRLYGTGIVDAAAAVKMVRRIKANGWVHRNIGAALMAVLLFFLLISGSGMGKLGLLAQKMAALGAGLCIPEAVTSLATRASYWNLLGHGVILPFVLSFLVPAKSPWERLFAWFGAGIAISLARDVQSGAAPFSIIEPARLQLWLIVNIIAAVWLFFNSATGPSSRSSENAGDTQRTRAR